MKPLVLAILDGWGFSKKKSGNPMHEASKPTFDALNASYPMILLQASGLAVGLPWTDYGNSEVGHLTIGAGRIVQQYQTRINKTIKDGTFGLLPVFASAFQHERIHIIGLLTSGSVHADLGHLMELIRIARASEKPFFLHLFADGKDSPLQECGTLLKKLPVVPATIIGRNFAMDRDNNWELTQVAYDLITQGKGEKTDDFSASLKSYYDKKFSDTKIPALVAPTFDGVHAGDACLFFNYREDSIRQLFQLFLKSEIPDLFVGSMTEYFESATTPFAFDRPQIPNNISEVLGITGKKHLHIAETLKYAHVTYFFNGLRAEPYPGETDVLVDSLKNLEEHPEMKAAEIADKIIDSIHHEQHDVIIANLANADMLAHTGNYEATKKGIETIDSAMGRIVDEVLRKDGTLLITSDHGNAEELLDPFTGEAESRHGKTPVPLYLISNAVHGKSAPLESYSENDVYGILADVAPTVLDLLAIPKPPEMTGESLLPKLLALGT